MTVPVVLLTQGDPAGVGPELILRLLAETDGAVRYVVVAESEALRAVQSIVPERVSSSLRPLEGAETGALSRNDLLDVDGVPLLDPIGIPREVRPGTPVPADAAGAIAALDLGSRLVASGMADALVTLPVSKASIATHLDPSFRGHTDYLARAAGLEQYGRDYLMTFLAPQLRVALLTVHLPLREALDRVTRAGVVEALLCLDRHAGGRIALAGLNPHAGEAGLLGSEEAEILEPAVAEARERGVRVEGPASADSLFARAARGEFDWVLALYHDQGLIAVKSLAPADSTNWTLGLPYLRTSVDHGTAFDIAGQGRADVTSLRNAVRATVRLLEERRSP